MIFTAALALLLGCQVALCLPRTWIYFCDKGYTSQKELEQALSQEEELLLPTARARLLKVRSPQSLITEADLPVSPAYLQEIERLTGQMPHAVCRTLNAASYAFDEEQLTRVQQLPCVQKTCPVRAFGGDVEVPAAEIPGKSAFRSVQDSLFYGGSYLQNLVENFPPAHDAGYTGEGVLVGQLDAGWNNLGHVCFDSLEIVATWDFVNGDSSVANDPGQAGDGSHGTKTLSCLAGYDPGNMVGTAYGISVALAKTENTESELPIEEDNWAAGIEWLDSLGCVIATSSVSYGALHSYEELDGNTTVITIAADNAVARGMVVLNSVSNHGSDPYPYNKMSPPSDGDSVLAIGAVTSDSTLASYSSLGPTYDGRIKPDLVAMGSSVWVASAYSPTNYTSASGTSFSTPLTAGACALLLQADPALTPMEVQAFLKATGTQAADPDTLCGWGIYNVWQAIQDALAEVSPQNPAVQPQAFRLAAPCPNPFNPVTRIIFEIPAAGNIQLAAYDVNGRQVAKIAAGNFSAGRHEQNWDATSLGSGIYVLRLATPWGMDMQKAVMLK